MTRGTRSRGNRTTAGGSLPEAETTDQRRRSLEADLEAYLASGKTIEQVPVGFTNQDPLTGRRHIVIGPGKPRAD